LKGCDVGITDATDLWSIPLRLTQVLYTYQFS
jgi:hypothetical protein